jgi:protein-S-isoprenylcysteine O-methyltransferase Ste14
VSDLASATPTDKEKGPVPFPPPTIYVAGLLLGIVAELVEPTASLHPAITITAGVIFIGLSIYLDGSATKLFVKNKTQVIPWRPASTLVTDGPYRFTRNPMYLGMACLYAGIAFSFGLLWAFAFLPVVILLVDRTVIAREEPYLEKKFGEAYVAYKSSVRRWI